jgi:hypothetical protein
MDNKEEWKKIRNMLKKGLRQLSIRRIWFKQKVISLNLIQLLQTIFLTIETPLDVQISWRKNSTTDKRTSKLFWRNLIQSNACSSFKNPGRKISSSSTIRREDKEESLKLIRESVKAGQTLCSIDMWRILICAFIID